MTLDDIVALIVGTEDDSTKDTLLPALKKLPQSSGSTGKGKGKDTTLAAAGGGGESNASTSNAPAPSQILVGALKDGSDPLDVLRPERKTVGYLFILYARLMVQNPDLNVLAPKVLEWATNFDPSQARLVLDQVHQLLTRLGQISQSLGSFELYLGPLKLITQRWAPAGTLTAFHSLFVRMAFHFKAYSFARDILYVDITNVDKTLFPIKYQDHLLYHYLGGTILALLGDYVRSSDLLEICSSAPGPSVSLIQLDAYKKLVLVQLLAYGKPLALPRYTTTPSLNAYKSLLVPYNEFALAFVSLDRSKVIVAREKAKEAFTRDHNFGLVGLVERSLTRRVILKLTDTWATTSLGQLTTLLGMDQNLPRQVELVEREVLSMVQNGELFATISQANPPSSRIVTFSDDPEPYLSHETVKRVTRAIERAKRLESSWNDEGEKMEQGKEFVLKMYQSLAAGGGGPGGVGLPPPMGGYSDEFDYGSSAGFADSIGRVGGEDLGGDDFDFGEDGSDRDDREDMD